MKKARDDKPVNTMPKGVYEGGKINEEIRKNNQINKITTDIQGNGYPVNKCNDCNK